MIPPLPIVGPGQPVSADDRNRLGGYARNITPRPVQGGRGGMLRLFPGGSIVTPRTRLQPPGLNYSQPSPFDISVVDDGAGGLKAIFRAGMINGLLPSNYLTGVAVPATGTKYLVLNLTASNGQITAASFTADASQPGAIAPQTGQPPTTFKLLIGIVIDANPTKIWGNGNINATPIEMFRVDRATPVAGQMPYDIYYSWQFNLA